MQLGAFSISLTVKDLPASKQFYEKFGFRQFGGDASQNWLILKNGDCIIGLFQGMFDKNMLTFQSGLGRQRPAARLIHRRPRIAATAQDAGRAVPAGGG